MVTNNAINKIEKRKSNYLNKRKGLTRVTERERIQRQERVKEEQRLINVLGKRKITRNAAHYISKIEKNAEDYVLKYDFDRDSDNYITEIDVRLEPRTV